MYILSLGSFACPLSFEAGGVRTTSFTYREVKRIISDLLDRKVRNNCVGRHLAHLLRASGYCRYDYRYSQVSGALGFQARRLMGTSDRFTVLLHGDYPHELLARLNQPGQKSRAVRLTQDNRAERRRLRALGLYEEPKRKQQPRALAGASGALKHHFQKSRISWLDAMTVIAYAARLDRSTVSERLHDSLDDRGVATLRLKEGSSSGSISAIGIEALSILTPASSFGQRTTIRITRTAGFARSCASSLSVNGIVGSTQRSCAMWNARSIGECVRCSLPSYCSLPSSKLFLFYCPHSYQPPQGFVFDSKLKAVLGEPRRSIRKWWLTPFPM